MRRSRWRLREGVEVFPTLWCRTARSCIDRRMGVYGHPLEIQALFYGTLVSAIDLLRDTPDVHELIVLADKRANMLRNYLQLSYWLVVVVVIRSSNAATDSSMLRRILSMLTKFGRRSHEAREEPSHCGDFDYDNDDEHDNLGFAPSSGCRI